MIIELVRKEILQTKNNLLKSSKEKILNAFIKAFFLAIFISLECFIFIMIDKKIELYSNYGTYDFLVLFLSALLLLGILTTTFKIRKVMYREDDYHISSTLPISSSEIIFSKIIFAYFYEALLYFVISLPILICFGINRSFAPSFYIFSFFFPFIISLFSVGVTLIFLVPYEYLFQKIKKYVLLQISVSCISIVCFCFLYKFVLDMFLISLDYSSVGGIFSKELVESIHRISTYLMPIENYLHILVYNSNKVSGFLLISGFILLTLTVGIILSSLFYSKMNKLENSNTNKEKAQKPLIIRNQFKSLLVKETKLLFNNSNNLFTYSSILILVPFLSFIVISSLNSIVYSSQDLFVSYFKELKDGLNITLILLFVSVSLTMVTKSIDREGACIRIIKIIPIDPFKQLLAKILLPVLISFISCFLMLLILVTTSQITVNTFFITFYLATTYLIFAVIEGLLVNMKEKNKKKNKFLFLNSFVTLLYPLFVFVIYTLMAFYKVDMLYIYLVLLTYGLIFIVISTVNIKKRIIKAFISMEVS